MTTQPPGDRLAVIVVNYGSADLLRANLALYDPRPLATAVVIVDNFTTDADAEDTRELADWMGWELVASRRNLGFGAGMNAGVERARKLGCTTFLLLNPDARVEPDVVEALFSECRENPLCAVAPRIVREDGRLWFSGATVLVDRGSTSTESGADSSAANGWITGACVTIHERLWERIGGFDNDYFLYWEDIDLSWRLTEAGGRLLVRDDLIAVHSVGGTQSSSGKSPLYVYYNCRNRMLFASKHLNRRFVLRWILNSPRYAVQVCTRGAGRRTLLRKPELIGAAVRGTVTGSIAALRARPA
ncbi:glycosyltransferase family 2 protein [Glaciibacter superstes]|uniref:glycosyltransferase family 2 protein n=1 Tax=Glaciibacter superstes TaxID=501023 RepID=UPI0003B5840A|nr:glycosyltransferase family 2 protein [Glaciibacter superstes]